ASVVSAVLAHAHAFTGARDAASTAVARVDDPVDRLGLLRATHPVDAEAPVHHGLVLGRVLVVGGRTRVVATPLDDDVGESLAGGHAGQVLDGVLLQQGVVGGDDDRRVAGQLRIGRRVSDGGEGLADSGRSLDVT